MEGIKSRVNNALRNGNCLSVEFLKCGKKVKFLIRETNNGRTCDESLDTSLAVALKLLNGYRFKPHWL